MCVRGASSAIYKYRGIEITPLSPIALGAGLNLLDLLGDVGAPMLLTLWQNCPWGYQNPPWQDYYIWGLGFWMGLIANGPPVVFTGEYGTFLLSFKILKSALFWHV